MLNSDPLYELVKSLSRSEKRYFKLQASLQTGKKNGDYVDLFEAIDKQSVWDESALKARFGSGKNYSALKRYLYDAILKSLRLFMADKNDRLAQLQLAQTAQVLLEKGLIQQALKVIDRLKVSCKKSDDLQFLQLAENMEQQITFRKIDRSQLKLLKSAIPQSLQTNYHIQQSLKLSALTFELLDRYLENVFARGDREKKAIEELMMGVDELGISSETPLGIQLRYRDFMGIANGMIGAHQASVAAKRASVALYEAHPDRLHKKLRSYINSIYNLSIELVRVKDWDACEEMIRKMEDLQQAHLASKNAAETAHIFFKLTSGILYLFICSGGFERAAQRIPRYLIFFGALKQEMSSAYQLSLMYQFAYAYYGSDQWPESLDWVEQILQYSEKNTSQMQRTAARMLLVLNHYELENWQLLPALVRSFYRFLRKLEKPMQAELLFLEMARALAKSPKEPQVIYASFLPRFEALQDDPLESRLFIAFDFCSWLESKMTGQSFGAVVRSKV